VRYSELFSVKRFLLLLVVSVASIYIGIGFGSIISGRSGSDNKQPLLSTTPNSGGVLPQGGSWVGTIRKVTPADINIEGGFKLVNENEKITAVLQSTKIDLEFVEGRNVTVEGRRVRNLNSDLPLILVEKVKFK
jgi:hypothetical protein